MRTKLLTGAIACTVWFVAAHAHSQDIFSDVVREAVDEARLRHDYRALQRDIANGNSAGAQIDLMRIQQDRANLVRDQIQLDYDLNRVGPVIPYQYSAGYYPSVTSGQMMYFNPMQQPTSQISPPPNSMPPSLQAKPASVVSAPPQIVRVSNPEWTGVTLGFVFGGRTYSIESGRTEEFTVTAPTVIAFSRGGQGGVARYTLAGGNTFEFRSDDSGWTIVQKRPELVGDAVPPNPIPRTLAPSVIPPSPGPVVP